MTEIDSDVRLKPTFQQPRVDGLFFRSGTSQTESQKVKAFRKVGARSWGTPVAHSDAPLSSAAGPLFAKRTRSATAAMQWSTRY